MFSFVCERQTFLKNLTAFFVHYYESIGTQIRHQIWKHKPETSANLKHYWFSHVTRSLSVNSEDLNTPVHQNHMNIHDVFFKE